MQIFKKILCPVDFSDYSSLALRYAVALARENDAELLVYHSIPDLSQAINYVEGNYIQTVSDLLTSRAEAKLADYVKERVPASVRITRTVGAGNPPEAILTTCRNEQIDLIVMGTHGYSREDRFFLGSVTHKVLHKATIPVMVVRGSGHDFLPEGDNPLEIRRILCPVDLDPETLHIRDFAINFAKAYGSELIFAHFVRESSEREWLTQQQEWLDKMNDLIDPSRLPELTIRSIVTPGEAAEEILRTVRDLQIDLVIMGHHTRMPLEEYFMGSVAKTVVTESNCPVVVARSTSDLVYSQA
jgi:nucleotide-binding universal stress UspA family protein